MLAPAHAGTGCPRAGAIPHLLRAWDLFWRIVADHPDDAYDWFAFQSDWILAKDSEGLPAAVDPGRYSRPFHLLVPKFDRAQVLLYARRDSIASSQAALLAYLLVVATIFPGRFTPFSLASRPAILAGAGATFVLGVVFVNL